jgi:hypothetical protein
MKTEKITQFTNANLDLLREKVEGALAAVGEKHNVKFDLGRITYSPTDSTASAKLRFEAKTAEGKPIDRARLAWAEHCHRFNLKPEWLDQTFTAQERTYKITGLNPKRPRLPVEITSDGKTIACPVKLLWMVFDPEGYEAKRIKEAHDEGARLSRWFVGSDEYSGLEPDWLDKTFEAPRAWRWASNQFKVEGLDTERKKSIVISHQVDGATQIGFLPVDGLLQIAGKAQQPKSKPNPKSLSDLRDAKPSIDALSSQSEAAKPAA